MSGAEAHDARRPAALFRSGNRDRSDAGPSVRSAAAPDGGLADIGAAVDGIGSRRARSHDAEPTGTDGAIVWQDTGNASQVEPLLDQIDAPIGQFTADGAYDGKPIYDVVTRHSAGAAVVIPPRSNAVDRSDTETANQRDWQITAINTDGRLKMESCDWLRQAFPRRDRDRAATSRSSDAAYGRDPLERNRPRLPSAARPQPHVGMRTPEIRPPHCNHRVNDSIKRSESERTSIPAPKPIAGQEKTKLRGRDRVGWAFTLGAAAYNLVRLPKLLTPPT